MSTKAIESLSEDTVRRIAEERDEPEWLLETRLNALSALETADLPDVIQTPGRRWTDLEALDFESLVDPLNQSMRSGVNWTRLKERLRVCATVCIKSVFASPGTPIKTQCPREKSAIKSCSTTSC